MLKNKAHLEDFAVYENNDRAEDLQKELDEYKSKNKVLEQKLGAALKDIDRIMKFSAKREDDFEKEKKALVLSHGEEVSKIIAELTGQQSESQKWYYQCIYMDNSIDEIKSSTSWKMTAPFRWFSSKIKRLFTAVPPLRLFGKFLKSVKESGLKAAIRKSAGYLSQHKTSREIAKAFNLNLSDNNFENCPVYESEYQENYDYTGYTADVKALAFYLPQFHRIPENDLWWGNGFTEWVNTKSSEPLFAGHYQPRTPHHDIGYYDLSHPRVLEEQAALAKQHGIYGFCFYYYWFSGKRLLEKPVDMLLENPHIDIPFCLCWANENWTRAWDGQDREVLMAQNYTENDSHQFIDDLKPYIDDKRYIRIKGKPVIIVYNPGQIPNIKYTFENWRKRANEIGVGEILIWVCETANNTVKSLNISPYIDAALEFPPHNMWISDIGVRDLDTGGKEAYIYNYQSLVKILSRKLKDFVPQKESVPFYRSCMLGWDNSARRKNSWTTFYAFSLKSFYDWCLSIIDYSRRVFDEDERFMFINAWNEWAEGTYLEPDQKYGYASINTLSKALFQLPFSDRFDVICDETDIDTNSAGPAGKIAVQIHLFYIDAIDEIIENLNYIPYSFDCFISTDTILKSEIIKHKFSMQCNADNVYVDLFDNRGRDVSPLLAQMKDAIRNYKYICHIHSKKTSTGDYGDMWRKYLYRNLFGSPENVKGIFKRFEDNSSLGLIFPETYPVLLPQAEWGGNREDCKVLLDRLGISIDLPGLPVFPVGNMFWAKTDAVSDIFDFGLRADDFPEEAGQTNATLAHRIERLWLYLAKSKGYGYLQTLNNCPKQKELAGKKRIAFFVHYEPDNFISEEDIYFVKTLKKSVETLIFISNSKLEESCVNLIKPFVDDVIMRENIGFDFGAWKDGLMQYGFENLGSYDQLILVNNSSLGPVYDLERVFHKMDKSGADFWGITLFSELLDGSYIGKSKIPEHLQSYFQVYEKNVFTSALFKSLWEDMPYYNEFISLIANVEVELTGRLAKYGFKYDVYIDETRILSKYLSNSSIAYEYPYELLLLESPFVKKKAAQYAPPEEKIKVNFLLDKLKYKFGKI